MAAAVCSMLISRNSVPFLQHKIPTTSPKLSEIVQCGVRGPSVHILEPPRSADFQVCCMRPALRDKPANCVIPNSLPTWPPSRRSGALACRKGGKWRYDRFVPQSGMRYAPARLVDWWQWPRCGLGVSQGEHGSPRPVRRI